MHCEFRKSKLEGKSRLNFPNESSAPLVTTSDLERFKGDLEASSLCQDHRTIYRNICGSRGPASHILQLHSLHAYARAVMFLRRPNVSGHTPLSRSTLRRSVTTLAAIRAAWRFWRVKSREKFCGVFMNMLQGKLSTLILLWKILRTKGGHLWQRRNNHLKRRLRLFLAMWIK